MTDNISLDQVRVSNIFNLKSLYELDDTTIDDDYESPFSCIDCDYYEPKQFNEKTKELQNSTSYFHLNCRSLSKNWDSFHDLLCELHDAHFSFDFIGISEVFKCDRDQRLALPGYHNIITRCRDEGNHGGVGLFIKQDINFKIREDLSIFIPHIFESIFVEVSSISSKNNIVGVIYRPNSQPKADIDIFMKTLLDLMNLITNENKHCTMMGDFNIDLLKYNSHEKTNNYVDNIFSNGFLPIITKPTRVTASSATLIDHIYTNNLNQILTAGIIVNDVADHFGTFHLVKSKSVQSINTCIKKRSFSDKNTNRFKTYLDEADFTEVLNSSCPNSAYTQFIDIYKCAFEKAFPFENKKVHKKFIKREPWMTTGLLTSARTKSKLLHKKFKKKLNTIRLYIYNMSTDIIS